MRIWRVEMERGTLRFLGPVHTYALTLRRDGWWLQRRERVNW